VRNKQAGYAMILEMVMVLLVMSTFFAMAIPGAVAMQQASNQNRAKEYVLQVANANVMAAYCAVPNAGCNSSVFIPMIPPSASPFQMSGYTYTYISSGSYWLFSASPVTNGQAYFIDSTGILRCLPWDGANPATVSSPVCSL
jgi:type II secretory pathway pseudopilin PulG